VTEILLLLAHVSRTVSHRLYGRRMSSIESLNAS